MIGRYGNKRSAVAIPRMEKPKEKEEVNQQFEMFQ